MSGFFAVFEECFRVFADVGEVLQNNVSVSTSGCA